MVFIYGQMVFVPRNTLVLITRGTISGTVYCCFVKKTGKFLLYHIRTNGVSNADNDGANGM